MTRRGKGGPSDEAARKRISMRFETLEAFQEEFRRNISNGGIFVATEEVYELRELVDVEIDLAFSGESILLTGDVVHRIPVELREAGVTPGVAIQFLEPAQKLRRRLGGIADVPTPSVAAGGIPQERRLASRRAARVDAEIRGPRGKTTGRTRNLSRTGALIEVDGEAPEVGESVDLTFTEPGGSKKLELRGSVVRLAESSPGTVGVQFDPSESPPTDSTQSRFIERAQSSAHTRSLGAIRGPIQPLGIATLLQMFASSAERGTLSLRLPSLRGAIVFEQGSLVHIAAGPARGVKALSRLLGHGEGEFQFVPEIESGLEREEPVTVTQVLMEAVWRVDELKRLDLSELPPEAKVKVDPRAVSAADDLEPSDRALLHAIGKGIRVGALLDAVEDFDLEVYTALLRLRERGLIRVRP